MKQGMHILSHLFPQRGHVCSEYAIRATSTSGCQPLPQWALDQSGNDSGQGIQVLLYRRILKGSTFWCKSCSARRPLLPTLIWTKHLPREHAFQRIQVMPHPVNIILSGTISKVINEPCFLPRNFVNLEENGARNLAPPHSEVLK